MLKPLQLAPLALLAPALSGQATIPLSGSYTSAAIGSKLGCSPSDITLSYELGTMTFDPAGTFTATRLTKEVCVSGAVPDLVVNDAGTYTLDSAGKLVLDYDPANPGTDTFELYLSPDRELAVRGPEPVSEAAAFYLLCREQVGAEQSDLEGAFGLAELIQTLNGTEFRNESAYGTFDVDGAGVASISREWHAIIPFGFQGGFDVGSLGPILVQPNGSLEVGGEKVGALCADGEFAFLLGDEEDEFSMTLLVKEASAVFLEDLAGDWNAHTYGGSSDVFFNHYAESGQVAGSISGPPGSLVFTGTTHIVTRTSASTLPIAFGGLITVLSDGSFVTAIPSSALFEGWFSEELGIGVMADISTIDFAEFGLLLRNCGSSFPFGVGTPGTGGATPRMTTGGLPAIGSDYTLAIEDALASAPAVIGVAGAPIVSGLPLLGGTVYLNPPATFLQQSVTIGGAGSASLTVTIPTVGTMAGLEFFAQGVVIDPGAPAGLAMTQAVSFTLCD